MKQFSFIGISLLLLLAITACQSDLPTLQTSKDVTATRINPHRVSIDSALSKASDLISLIENGAKTRTSRHIRKVECMKFPQTRSSEDTDTALYLINYEEGGFALMGADDRLPSVFAISEEGELNWSDTVSNKGLEMYYDYITDAIQYAALNLEENGETDSDGVKGRSNGYYNWSVELGFKGNPVTDVGGGNIREDDDTYDYNVNTYHYFNTSFRLVGGFPKQ